ncbi:short chain dehydrogenase [Hypoxylon argillaceum]|nr:short chain dehydrogenase [Hypoxylon argillaceum]
MVWSYKTVLMVGCTAGLGIAMAERMIENGSFVIAVGRRKDRLDDFASKHGADKVAISQFDITDVDGIKAWAEGIVKAHPTLDCVVLNAGLQRGLNFTKPADIDLALVRAEIDTNYTAHIALLAAFLPHLQARPGTPAAVVAVSSGLGLVPLPRCANYCGTKAALHALVWALRAQLRGDEGSRHVRVVEIIPPAVQTELHILQDDLREAGFAHIGITIEEYMKDCWAGLESGEEEILVGPVKQNFSTLEVERRQMFQFFLKAVEDGKLPK